MGKMTIYSLLFVMLSYTGCALTEQAKEASMTSYEIDEEAEEALEEEEDSYNHDDIDLADDDDEESMPEPVTMDELEADDEEEVVQEEEPEDYTNTPAVESYGRMASLKRDCHIRMDPNSDSESLVIVKDLDKRIWVEPGNDRFYKVKRWGGGIAFMWKHCFYRQD